MFSIFLLIPMFGSIECATNVQARIGDYSHLITDYNQCGVSTFVDKLDNKCFQFHQNFYPLITSGRNASISESPWIVMLELTKNQDHKWGKGSFSICTGTLISREWIVTAAHCLTGKADYRLRFGSEFLKGKPIKSERHVMHPKYVEKSTGFYYDIALIKIKSDEIDHNIHPFICLPPNDTYPKYNEPTFFGGWGKGHEKYLKIGTLVMERDLEMDTGFHQISFKNGSTICRGDSGSPVWQYYSGRAVLLGVHHGGDGQTIGDTGCSRGSHGVYVPKVMDWILKNIADKH